MSEFDKLKDQAEQEIKEHPEQVKEGEQAAEKKLGLDSQGDQHGQGNVPQDDQAGQSQGGQSQGGQSQGGQSQGG